MIRAAAGLFDDIDGGKIFKASREISILNSSWLIRDPPLIQHIDKIFEERGSDGNDK